MAYSVTVTSTKLIIDELGIQVRFDGRDIIKATATNALTPQTNTSPREYIVQLLLTGDAASSGLPNPYIIRMSDVSNQITWTNDTAGCNQAAADISVMIRSITSGGGGGQVDTIVPGDGIDVDSTDPVNPIVSARVKNSIEFDAAEMQLVGDEASPGNSEYYGTDGTGTKGFYPLPAPGTGDVVGPASSVDNNIALFDGATGKLIKDSGYTPGQIVIPTGFGDIDLIETGPGFWPVEIKGGLDGDGTTMQSNTGSFQVNVNPKNSIEIDAAQVQLVGDEAAPGNSEYYGTDGSGVKGFYPLPIASVPIGIANGGTGQTTQTAAFDALAPTTTKGDIIVHDGTDNIRVAIGSDGMVPFADSGATSGIEWRYYPMTIELLNQAVTLTNQPNTLEILSPALPGIFVTRADLTNYTEVMLQIHVFVASGSANSPRIILGYANSYTLTPGSYSDIGTSAVTCSMSATGIIRSSWIPIAAGALGDVFISPLSNGGNGGADPQIQGVRMYVR